MKRVLTSTCLAMLCAAGLAAQTQADDQRRKAEPSRAADEKSVTLVGCLRAGDTPNSFVLANVKPDESAAMPSAATPTPAPTTPPTDPPSTPPSTPPPTNPPAAPPTADPVVGTSGAMASGEVRLIGAPASLDLTKHIGHTVAITGSWAASAKAADRPAGTTGSEKSMGSAMKSFNVKSLAHKSETCK